MRQPHHLAHTKVRDRIPPGECIHGHNGCGTPLLIAHDTWCEHCQTWHCNQKPTARTVDPLDDPNPF